ncbi:NAD(P)H-binding protein [Aeromicrobium sp. CF4.19]|uniref:NAD(P)H-binding protein n=1 Tax=Aeromicrobium sp. CF4.19 TaxID=3373082 RepID=UPI003EE784ED
MTARRHLVTGVTGFVGARLAERLVEEGRSVRVLVRDPARLPDAPWVSGVEVVTGDVGGGPGLADALQGVDVAYYLVHAMSDGDDYAAVDLRLATAFARACADAGVARIVYLGGLLPTEDEPTEHLASRREVGQVFLDGPVPAAVLQAGMVVGRGSASFELMELAVRWLPVIVGPSWLNRSMQPIALPDLLHYLVGVADLPADVNRTFDVGGPDVLRYRDLIAEHARAGGRRAPTTVTVPVPLPHTLSFVVGEIAPGPSSLNSALAHSLSVDMVCTEHDIAEHVGDPPGGLTGVEDALRLAHD